MHDRAFILRPNGYKPRPGKAHRKAVGAQLSKDAFAMSAAQQTRGRLNMQPSGLKIYASQSCRRMRAHAADRVGCRGLIRDVAMSGWPRNAVFFTVPEVEDKLSPVLACGQLAGIKRIDSQDGLHGLSSRRGFRLEHRAGMLPAIGMSTPKLWPPPPSAEPPASSIPAAWPRGLTEALASSTGVLAFSAFDRG
jgi:hypothetical protein